MGMDEGEKDKDENNKDNMISFDSESEGLLDFGKLIGMPWIDNSKDVEESDDDDNNDNEISITEGEPVVHIIEIGEDSAPITPTHKILDLKERLRQLKEEEAEIQSMLNGDMLNDLSEGEDEEYGVKDQTDQFSHVKFEPE